MRIRRFTADTMPLALQAVKLALGPEAVILETAETNGQSVVTAAVDDDGPVAGAPTADGELVHEVRALLAVVRRLADERFSGPQNVRPEVACLHHRLVEQGVDAVIAAALVRATAERLDDGVPVATALAGTLASAAAPATTPRVRLFVGPPGDGKTTTIVKLAAAARRAGRQVALVTADTYRVGAATALAAYGRVLGVEVATAADPDELRGVLGGIGAEVVLVDTAGVSPGQTDELAEGAEMTRVAGPDAGRTLAASATHGRWAAERTWDTFERLAPASCVLTKVDLAPGGPLLGLCWRAQVPVSHVATGRRVLDDLEPATPDRLARCLLAA